MQSDDLGTKAIVFSQFVNMLDLINYRVQRGGIACVKLSGSMNLEQRDKAISAFKSDPSVKVMLISLKAGGVALNLTVASRIFLMGKALTELIIVVILNNLFSQIPGGTRQRRCRPSTAPTASASVSPSTPRALSSRTPSRSAFCVCRRRRSSYSMALSEATRAPCPSSPSTICASCSTSSRHFNPACTTNHLNAVHWVVLF